MIFKPLKRVNLSELGPEGQVAEKRKSIRSVAKRIRSVAKKIRSVTKRIRSKSESNEVQSVPSLVNAGAPGKILNCANEGEQCI